MSRGRGRAGRPVRIRPLVLMVLIALALFGVARTTGAGWLVVLVSGVVAVVPFAFLWPAIELRRAVVDVQAAPDAVVGRPADITIAVTGNRHPLLVELTSPPSPRRAVAPAARGRVEVVPARRGVVREVALELRSGAPLGLVWWRSSRRIALPRPMEVAPRPVPASVPMTTPAGASGEGRTRGRTGSDTVRTVRDYHVGDPIRLVHWAATARTGDLMVKELEGPDTPRLVVVVDLSGGDEERVEHAASVAAGLVASALASGVSTLLVTVEEHGPVVAQAGTPAEAGRRLARTVAGTPPAGGWLPGATVLRVGATGVVEERS